VHTAYYKSYHIVQYAMNTNLSKYFNKSPALAPGQTFTHTENAGVYLLAAVFSII